MQKPQGSFYALRFAALSALWLVTASATRPAHAGYWLEQLQVSGSEVQDGDTEDVSGTGYGDQASAQSPFRGEGDQNSATITVTPTLIWQSNGANDPPPQLVDLLYLAEAYGSNSQNDYPIVVDDGFGDPYTPDLPDDEEEQRGLHLVHQGNSSRASTLTFPAVALNASGGLGDDGGSARVGCVITVDSRDVTLHRSGAVGEWEDDTGTVHGDTIYSMHDYVTDEEGGGDSPNILDQTISSVLSGDWGVRSD